MDSKKALYCVSSNKKLTITEKKNALENRALPSPTLLIPSSKIENIKVMALGGKFTIQNILASKSYLCSRQNAEILLREFNGEDLTLSLNGAGKITVATALVTEGLEINFQDNSTGMKNFNGTTKNCDAYHVSHEGAVRITGEVMEKFNSHGVSKARIYYNELLEDVSVPMEGIVHREGVLNISGPSGIIERNVRTVGIQFNVGSRHQIPGGINRINVAGMGRGKTVVTGGNVTIETIGRLQPNVKFENAHLSRPTI